MEEQKILLSIIIPVHNGEKYIRNCLDSIILNKSQTNYEIIIIDDGSTDGSKNIYTEYLSKNIKAIKIKKSGVSKARNVGIQESSGEYLMFVDADDILFKQWGKIVGRKLQKNDADIILFSNRFKQSKLSKKELIQKIILGWGKAPIAGPWSKIFKRDFLIKNSINFNTKIINGEDMIFNTKAIIAAKKIRMIDDAFYKYRVCQSTTKKFDKKIFDSDIIFIKELKAALDNQKILTESESKELITKTNKNCIYIIYSRLSYANDYALFHKYNKQLIFYKKQETSGKLKPIQEFLYILIRLRLTYIAFKILQIRNKRNKTEEYFVTI